MTITRSLVLLFIFGLVASADAQLAGLTLEHPAGVGIRYGDNNLQGFEVVKRCLHWLR